MSVIGGLPDSAIVDADVPDVGLADDAVDSDRSPASEGANVSPFEGTGSIRAYFLGTRKASGGEKKDDGEDSHKEILAVCQFL